MSSPNAIGAMLEPAETAPAPDGSAGLGEPVAPRRPPTVKCPRCLTVGTADDVRCVACQAPLWQEQSLPVPVNRGRRAARLALLFLAIGAAIGPLAGNGISLIGPRAAGTTVNLLLWGGLSGAIGAAAGYILGQVAPRRR